MRQIMFEHIQGGAVYLIWYIHNDCILKLETLMAIDLNLELFITSNNDVLAFRHDHPEEMIHMVKNDGSWRYTIESDLLNPNDQLRLRMSCQEYSQN